VRCSDTVGGLFRANFSPLASSPSTIRFRVSFLRQAIDPPFSPPVTMTLVHNGGVVRSGTITQCDVNSGGLTCRQP